MAMFAKNKFGIRNKNGQEISRGLLRGVVGLVDSGCFSKNISLKYSVLFPGGLSLSLVLASAALWPQPSMAHSPTEQQTEELDLHSAKPMDWAHKTKLNIETKSSASQLQEQTQAKKLMQNAKQLTFEGARSGEGYFSRDGRSMVFQSEREPGNPFYQIYLMDLQSGKSQRLSPGKGKTTCAWVHPSMKKVMFSSTHLDPKISAKEKEEYQSRQSTQKQKYAWSYDETFDIFESDLNGKNLKRLTHEIGYDAEGSYSPDGKWIAFASNRAGYTEKLSDEDQKLFQQDPSYMMDIYLMKADGTQVKRLTNTKGYDGGPFFSADGQHITWRRFAANGQTAEIYTMNLDGSHQQAVTHLNAMSWAPFFHPSGDYIVFTSNILGYSNFELFIVDTKGAHEPVRVSYIDGFDGLPVFSPDGKKLSWTHRNDKGDSQIWMADWNDDLARALLGLNPNEPKVLAQGSPQAQGNTQQGLRRWISYLASDALKGRRTGSPEEMVYSQKIADVFKSLHLAPMFKNKSYLQEFEFVSGVGLGEQNKLILTGSKRSPKLGEDFMPVSFSRTGEFASAPVVFSGYGMKVPASDKQAAYDSYLGVDVNAKWVLVFRDLPEDVPSDRRQYLSLFSRVQHKATVARNLGALGLLVIQPSTKALATVKFEGALSDSSLAVINVSVAMAADLLGVSIEKIEAMKKELDSGMTKDASEVQGVQLSAQVDLKVEKAKGHNVVALLKVPGAKQTVMVGAHGDHLGIGEIGSSLARGDESHIPHYGADDNASGVAGVMELARIFSENPSARKNLKQNIAFAVWSGEEIGLLGSYHFTKNFEAELTEVKKIDQTLSAYLNMDMIGRLRESLMVQGVGSSSAWRKIFEQVAQHTSVPFVLQDDPFLPTDSMAFYLAGVPSISLFTGAHSEYHTPRDTFDLINYEGTEKVVSVMREALEKVARGEEKIDYKKVEGSQKKMEGRSFRIYLGTIPDYSQEGVKGVRISGVAKDGPAEKAGLQAKDVIIELDRQKVENLYDYVYALQGMKANKETTVRVLRAGESVELKILPLLKE